jgi:hypothetical protein
VTAYENIYSKMEKLGIFLVKQHIRVKNGCYMDFIVENLGSPSEDVEIYSLAHYHKMNGDLIPDPEMEIEVNHKLKTAEALTFETGNFGRRYSYKFDGLKKTHVYPAVKKDNNGFLQKTWLKNLKEQGFGDAIKEHLNAISAQENSEKQQTGTEAVPGI